MRAEPKRRSVTNPNASIVLLPCNGISARGQLSAEVAKLLLEQLDEVDVVWPVPLAAGLPESVTRFDNARFVLGLAGCEQHCDAAICAQSTGFKIDDSVLLGDAVRDDVSEMSELGAEERKELVLLLTSRVLAKISEID